MDAEKPQQESVATYTGSLLAKHQLEKLEAALNPAELAELEQRTLEGRLATARAIARGVQTEARTVPPPLPEVAQHLDQVLGAFAPGNVTSEYAATQFQQRAGAVVALVGIIATVIGTVGYEWDASERLMVLGSLLTTVGMTVVHRAAESYKRDRSELKIAQVTASMPVAPIVTDTAATEKGK